MWNFIDNIVKYNYIRYGFVAGKCTVGLLEILGK